MPTKIDAANARARKANEKAKQLEADFRKQKSAAAKVERESFAGQLRKGMQLGLDMAPAMVLIEINKPFAVALAQLVGLRQAAQPTMIGRLTADALAVATALAWTMLPVRALQRQRTNIIALGLLFGISDLIQIPLEQIGEQIARFISGQTGQIFGVARARLPSPQVSAAIPGVAVPGVTLIGTQPALAPTAPVQAAPAPTGFLGDIGSILGLVTQGIQVGSTVGLFGEHDNRLDFQRRQALQGVASRLIAAS